MRVHPTRIHFIKHSLYHIRLGKVVNHTTVYIIWLCKVVNHVTVYPTGIVVNHMAVSGKVVNHITVYPVG